MTNFMLPLLLCYWGKKDILLPMDIHYGIAVIGT